MKLAEKNWGRWVDHLEERERRRAQKLPSWRTQRRRRALTMLLAGTNLALIVVAVLLYQDQLRWSYLVWVGLFAVWMLPFALLRILTGKMSSSFSALLDEREREWRHRVSYAGYHSLCVLMIIALFYLLAIAEQPHAAERGAMMLATLLLVGSSVPAMLLGWTLPDDVVEEDSVA